MSFLVWYQKVGLPTIWQVVGNYVLFVKHFFSLSRLTSSLFAPWKKTDNLGGKKGLGFGELLDRLSFDLTSRVVGFGVRSVTIVVGVMAILSVMVIGGLAGVFLSIFPLPLYPFYQQHVSVKQRYRSGKSFDEMKRVALDSDFYGFFCRRTGVSENDLKQWLADVRLNSGELLARAHKFVKQKGYGQLTDSSVVRSLIMASEESLEGLRKVGLGIDEVDLVCDWFHFLVADRKKFGEYWRKDYLLSLGGIGKEWTSGYTPFLDEFCEELEYSQIRLKPYYGRMEETERVIQILSGEKNPDVLIYGPPGSGKKSMILGLAHKIVWHEASKLRHRRILLFKAEEFLAKTSERDAAGVLRGLLKEAVDAGNVILVINGLDQLLLSKNGEHNLDGVLEEMLPKDKLQVVGLATSGGFHKVLAEDRSVMKMFTPVELEPMRGEAVFRVLFDEVEMVERRHGLYFSFGSLKRCIELCEKYMPGEPFPEKALSVLGEVITNKNSSRQKRVVLGDVEMVVSQRVGVPIGDLHSNERQELLNVDEELGKYIVDQGGALNKISKSLRRNRVGVVARTNKPMGSFLFLGPTGVGKTETAKVLSRLYFKTDDLLRIDMAEFQSGDALSRLIGTADDSGVLARKIRSKPYGVLLLDEFEKSPVEVMNIFLSILDEGKFSTGTGEEVYCNNLMIIATSNAGSEAAREYLQGHEEGEEFERYMVDYLLRSRAFSPELLNRFDSVVFYTSLSEKGLRSVVRLELEKLKQHLQREKQIELVYGDELVERIVSQGYEADFGARSVLRYIQDEVEDEIAKKILAEPGVSRVEV